MKREAGERKEGKAEKERGVEEREGRTGEWRTGMEGFVLRGEKTPKNVNLIIFEFRGF